MDELKPLLESSQAKLEAQDGLHWIPIRHHSPACAFYLLDLLEQHNPSTVLIEGSIDFNAQLLFLGHTDNQTPVALYGGKGFFPLSETSPEWHALRWALTNKKNVRFIDLPIKDKAWQKEELAAGQISFVHEARLQHNDFVNKLVSQSGCRNGDELWERWFELKEFDNAKSFFDRVFEYCTAARLTYSTESIDDSGDSAREAFMADQIRIHASKDQDTFIITGGFHTYALLNASVEHKANQAIASEQKNAPEQTWLIRYSQDRLDTNNGYSAGMPAPNYYERLFNYRLAAKEANFATELVLDTLAILACDESLSITINTADKLAVCQQALGLSQLRGNTWPGLFDTLDAVSSVLIKHESSYIEPLLVRAREVLAGHKLGSVSSDQPPLPLVNDVYQKLKHARFKLDSTTKVSTDLSLYKSKNRARMNLLYQCQFMALDFANKTSGPDWIRGNNLHLRHEEWQYAWTPWVEAKLVDLSVDGADWEALLLFHINKKTDELEHSSLEDCQQLFVQLVLMGKLNSAAGLWKTLDTAIAATSNCDQLTPLLFLLLRLRHTQSDLFENFSEQLEQLVTKAWRQLMYLLPNINQRELQEGLTVLLQVQELTQEFDNYFEDHWKPLWVNQLQWMISHGELSCGLLFACKTLLIELGQNENSDLLKAIKILFDVDDEAAYQAVLAVLNIAPHWLKQHNENSILGLLNTVISGWSESRFFQSLPDLRFLFSHLDPETVEQLGAQLCHINQWDNAPEVFNPHINEQQLIQAQHLQHALSDYLEQQGLDHWITH